MSSKDERIVEMQFENQKFEKNAKQTLGTINELDEALKFKDSSKSFKNIEKESKKLSLAALSNSIGEVGHSFSVMEVAAITALSNIVNRAVDAGLALAKSLTIDQVSAGFSKYEKSTESIVAIMNQTGAGIEEVTKYIEKLAWYSDVTSFDFNSMVAALTSFVSQGMTMEESIPIIMGIGNSVTYAGKGAKDGSRAFDLYARAIANGSMDLMRWRTLSMSIGVGTKELKEQFMDAAVAAGTLTKNSKGIYKTTSKSQKAGQEVNVANFDTTLALDWLKTDVMNSVLGKMYGSYSKRLSDFTEQYEQLHGVTLTLSEATELFNKEMAKEAEAAEKVDKPLHDVGDVIDGSVGGYKEAAKSVDEFGEKVLYSATVAKTFTEAVDAVKDAASSQFKSIFESIFGNADEAMDWWTEFSDWLNGIFITPLSNLNLLISKWKELGGRDDLIKNFWEIIDAFKLIIQPVKEAFRNIFPPKTAESLKNATDKLHDLAQYITRVGTALKETGKDEERNGFRRTLEGLFSIIDIGKQAISALVRVLKPLGQIFIKITKSVSKVTGNWGDYIKNVAESWKETDFLYNKLIDIKNAIITVANNLSKSLTGFDVATLLQKASTKIGELYEKIKNLVDVIANSKAVQSVKDFVRNLLGLQSADDEIIDSDSVEKSTTLLDKLGSVLQWIWQQLSKISQLLFGKLLKSDAEKGVDEETGLLTKLGNVLDWVLEQLQKIGKSILDMFGNGLSKFKDGNGLQALAEIFTAVVTAFGMIKISEIGISLAWIGESVGQLLEMFSGGSVVAKMVRQAMLFAVAIGILSVSLKLLSTISPSGLATGIVAIGAMLYGMIEAFKKLSLILVGNQGGGKAFEKVAKGLISVGLSMAILAIALRILSKIKVGDLVKSVVALELLFLELTEFLDAMAKNNVDKITKGFGSLAFSMILFAVAMRVIAKLSWEDLAKGLGTIEVLLTTLTFFTKKLDGRKIKSACAGLVLVGVSMLIFARAVKKFSKMGIKDLAKGVGAIAVLLFVLKQAFKEFSGGVGGAASILIVAFAMQVFAKAMKSFGDMSLMEIAKGILSIALVMAILVAAMYGLSLVEGSVLRIGFAMLIVSVAAIAFAEAFNMLGQLSLEQIITSLIALGGAMLILYAACVGLAPLAPVLLAIGGAIALIGTGVLALSAALAIIVPLISTIAAMLPEIAQVLVGLIAGAIIGIAENIGLIVETLMSLFSNILASMASLFPQIMSFITELITNVCALLIENVPIIAETISQLVVLLLEALNANLPLILEQIGTLITTVLDWIIEMVPTLVDRLVKFLLAIMDGIATAIPTLVSAFIQMLADIINGVANALRTSGQALGQAIANLISAVIEFGFNLILGIIEGLVSGAGKVFAWIGEFFGNIWDKVGGFFGNIWDKISGFFGNIWDKVGGFFGSIWDKITGFFGNIWDKISGFFGNIWDKVKGFFGGIGDRFVTAKDNLKAKASEIINGIKEKFNFSEIFGKVKQFFIDTFQHFKDKIQDAKDRAHDIIEGIKEKFDFSKIVEKVKGFFTNEEGTGILDIFKRKKKDMESSGENLMEGVSTGIKSKSEDSKFISGIKGVANKIGGLFNNVFKIASPSKVFAEKGMYLMLGLAQGISDYAKDAEKESLKAAKGVSNSLVFDAAGLDPNPKITPVLDLSEIQNRKNVLENLLNGKSISVSGNIGSSIVSQGAIEAKLSTDISALKSELSKLNTKQINENGLASALKTALADTDLYIDGTKAGRLITRYQANYKRSAGV